MKYKNYVASITKALSEYKGIIDRLEAGYKQDKQKLKNTAEEMRGQWTDEYIEKYKRENNPLGKYKKQMQDARAKYEPTILHYLELIKKQLDGFFNAPVKAEFANKINAIKISGLKLSNLEFELLKETATSYMEYRLLNQLAESRTETRDKFIFNPEHPNGGQSGVEKVEVSDPYIGLELPDIDGIYKRYNDYTRSAKALLYSYAGTKAELSEALDGNIPNYVAIFMDSYFRNKAADEFLGVMDKANSILPESKVKRELTENDRKLIDTLVDTKYPTLAEGRVKEIAANSPELAELFALDERYAQYVNTEE